jgi:hypothetical protein
MSFGSAGSDEIEQSVGVIASVGNDMVAFEAGQQMRGRIQIMGLAGRQDQPHGQTVFIH